MPDLPPLDDSPRPEAPPSAAPSTAPGSVPADKPPRRLPFAGGVAGIAALIGVLLYGLTGFLREAGLYDVSRFWSKPREALSLAAMPAGHPAPAGTGTPHPARTAPGTAAATGGSLRDLPPRPPPAELPRFTVRDGEQYDFLTDLDAETLKRLAEIQGQLDGLGAIATQLQRTVNELVRITLAQRQQEATHQGRVQQDLSAARQEIATLQTAVEEVDARLKRARAGQELAVAGAADASGRVLRGWSVTAISGNRAWLRSPRGQAITVVAGERLKAVGTVKAVDAPRGIVVMGDGRVVR